MMMSFNNTPPSSKHDDGDYPPNLPSKPLKPLTKARPLSGNFSPLMVTLPKASPAIAKRIPAVAKELITDLDNHATFAEASPNLDVEPATAQYHDPTSDYTTIEESDEPLAIQDIVMPLKHDPTNPFPVRHVMDHPKRIGTILVDRGFIRADQLEKALAESKSSGGPLGSILIRSGAVNEDQLGMCLAELHGLEYIRAQDIILKPEVIAMIPEDFVKKNLVIPHWINTEQERLEVIIAHPDRTNVLDEIALMTRYRVVAKVCTTTELVALIDTYYARNFVAEDVLEELEKDVISTTGDSAEEAEKAMEINADSAPVVKFVNGLFNEAIDRGASDVHLEPQAKRLLVRMRIDGILTETHSLGVKIAPAIISRMKVMANMDISERRRPQDGRIKHKTGSSSVDMRANTIPIQFGEKMVLRVLKMSTGAGQLDKLGMSDENMNILSKMIRSPHGIILVTGPTGSGKTTTLYASLRDISSVERNVTTIEDPIEYVLAGINQMQVQPKAGLTFAKCLRALLRQDPDVIMVGEIRDKETLEAAFHAAMTGHLVFSTIHTNSCAKTVARLFDMGAPPYLVSTSIVGIIAQRLVRSLCRHCKAPAHATKADLELLGMDPNTQDTPVLHKAVGCNECGDTGYKGRVGIYEIMPINREISRLIDEQASTVQIEDMAIQNGMKRLLDDARRLVLEGITTTQEVRRTLGYSVGD